MSLLKLVLVDLQLPQVWSMTQDSRASEGDCDAWVEALELSCHNRTWEYQDLGRFKVHY